MNRVLVRSLLVVLACAALATLASGCGQDETKAKNAYVAAVNVAQERFQRTSELLQADISTATSTAAEDRQALERLSGAVKQLVAELKAISTPDVVVTLHAALITAVAGFEPVIAARRAATDEPDPRRVITARTRFSNDFADVNDRVQTAIDQINAKLRGG